ncbi:MAG TPA: hypothetical protein ENN03_03150 [bacterium]|nr:hypothetical protein [bacterium]
MKKMTILVLTGLVFMGQTACQKRISADDRLIDPLKRVGVITSGTSESDLIRFFGKEHVERVSIHLGEGELAEGTVLFPGKESEVSILWQEAFRNPVSVTITGAEWKTEQNIGVGSSLEQVEAANGGPFEITGFAWDYPGRTLEWHGFLPQQLQLDLVPADSVPMETLIPVMGDDFFMTDQPVIRSLNLKVKRVFIRWDAVENLNE